MNLPDDIGLNFKTYKWFEQTQTYKPPDDEWFKISYPLFITKGKPHSKEAFYELIAFAYSWMPTIPNVKKITDEEWCELSELFDGMDKNEDLLKRLLIMLVPKINNSIVGTSKVIHFINPDKYPIIDSRVVEAWNNAFGGDENLKMKATILSDPNKERQILCYLKFRDNLITWQTNCQAGLSVRDFEKVLYYHE